MKFGTIAASVAAAAMLAAAQPAFAHKVVMDAYQSGDSVEGELGFSDGTMSQDTLVEVFDASGAKVGETRTDKDGVFVYKPAAPGSLTFRANLGAGHVGTTTFEAEDAPAPAAAATEASSAPAAASGVDVAELTRIVGEQVRREMKPLRQEIFEYKEKNDLQTILGGIGYIVGLFGIGFYVAARRKGTA